MIKDILLYITFNLKKKMVSVKRNPPTFFLNNENLYFKVNVTNSKFLKHNFQ